MTPDDLRKAKYTRIQRRRREGVRAGTWEYRRPVDEVIEHVSRLRAAGMSAAAIAAAAGLSLSTVSPFVWPERRAARQFVLPPTAAALLAVQGPAQAPGWAWIPNVATRRQIEGLQCMGWPLGYVAVRLGVSRQAIGQTKRRARVQVEHATRITAIYDELCMRPGPDAKTRAWAAKQGYVPPLCWDEDTIGDPAAAPNFGRSDTAHDSAPADDAVIERVLVGEPHNTNLAEREAVIPRLAARGMTDTEIAELVGCWPETVLRTRRRLGVESRWVA